MLNRVIILLLAFLVGLAGNLIASWMQQDVLANAFTPARVAAIALFAGIILLLSAWLERKTSASKSVKEYHVSESLDSHEVDFDYYSMPLEGDPPFAFKVSSISNKTQGSIRKTLTFTLANTTDKPIKVVSIQFENGESNTLPLNPLGVKLPKVLEAFIDDLATSIIIDQLWAYAQVTDKRFTHPFSSLFYFKDLTMHLESVTFKFSDGTSYRHKLSREKKEEVGRIFNPAPKIHNLPTPETKCSVNGCSNKADYVVLLYDSYDPEIFFEQDFTCPFLCEDHMQENERGINNQGFGERRYPSTFNHYPYSRQSTTTGYTKYLPLKWLNIS